MVKLKLQYFGHLMQRTDSREKPWSWARLKAGGEGADRGWDGWVASLILWTYVWVSSRSWWWTRKPGMLQSMQTWLSNWTELNWWFFTVIIYGWESWTIKNAECWRIEAFKVWRWRRLLRVPWIAKRSTSQSYRKSTLNILWKGWYCSWSISTLATWCENRLIGKDHDLGEDWRQNEKEMAEDETDWMASAIQWTWIWANFKRQWRTGHLVCFSPWGHKESDMI